MNKRIIALFAVIAIFVSVVVLMAAVFVVRDISVISSERLGKYQADAVAASKIDLNTNIFTVSVEKAAKNIELAIPEIKVIEIQRIFPGKILIRIDERYPLVAVPIENTPDYALLDEDLKILAVSNAPSAVIVSGFRLQGVSSDHAGQFVETSENNNTYKLSRLSAIIHAMRKHGFIADRFLAFISAIDLSRTDYIVLKTVFGMNIAYLSNSNLSADDQFDYLYSYFCNNVQNKFNDKYIYVYKNSEGQAVIKTADSLPL